MRSTISITALEHCVARLAEQLRAVGYVVHTDTFRSGRGGEGRRSYVNLTLERGEDDDNWEFETVDFQAYGYWTDDRSAFHGDTWKEMKEKFLASCPKVAAALSGNKIRKKESIDEK